MHYFSRGLSIFIYLCLCPLNARVVPCIIWFLTSLSRVSALLGELHISHGLFFSWYFYPLQTFCHLLFLSLKDSNYKRWGRIFLASVSKDVSQEFLCTLERRAPLFSTPGFVPYTPECHMVSGERKDEKESNSISVWGFHHPVYLLLPQNKWVWGRKLPQLVSMKGF